MRYDIPLKDLLWSGAPEFLRQLTGAPVAHLERMEYVLVRRQPDLVARLTDGRLYHLEVHGKNSQRIPWRMLEYYVMISGAHGGQAVLQQVLYIGQAPMRLPPWIDHPHLSFSFEVVDARTFDAERLLASPALEDNILAFLCWHGDMRDLVRTVLERALGPRPGRDERHGHAFAALERPTRSGGSCIGGG